jgi:hypothetical protein
MKQAFIRKMAGGMSPVYGLSRDDQFSDGHFGRTEEISPWAD